LQDLYEQTKSGYWFSKDTMRVFNSRITEHFRRIDDKTALFISTELGPLAQGRRRATVRIARITETGKIDIGTVGDFNRMSLPIAVKFMKAYEVSNGSTVET
jgi:hypothetical protein